MRLPVIPFVVAATLLGLVYYLFSTTQPSLRVLDVPHMRRLADLEGVETEVALTPDGHRVAVIASGDVWLLNLASGERKQLTRTTEPESFPSWTPDARQIAFTRGNDTFTVDPDTVAETLFRTNATSLSWSSRGQITFIRERTLWLANTNDQSEKKLVEADSVPDIEIRSPRFSPDSQQIAFVKSQLGIRGEVWTIDISTAMARPLVGDRMAENPLDTAWINDGQDLAYLTNRAGAYSVWYVDLAQSTINPLTQPIVTVPLARIGMGVARDRIVMPRHFVDSNIVLSDGTGVATSDKLEFQPAVSPDGRVIAYTVANDNKFEIWTVGIHGENPAFRTLGREPRFSANGFQVVYTYTDLNGNEDIWKLDIRNGSAEPLTDADEIDLTPDWSPDGQSIAFSSARGGTISVWEVPASGGKRLRLNEAGYAPRYSADGKSLIFWKEQSLWILNRQDHMAREVARNVVEPVAGVWSKSKEGPAYFVMPPGDRLAWPAFDVLSDGRFVLAPIDIQETGLWAVDLSYKEK